MRNFKPGSSIGGVAGGGGVDTSTRLGGPVTFRMYGNDSAAGEATVQSIHNNGTTLSDSAGAIAGSTPFAGYRSQSYGGGAAASIDAARHLGLSGDQDLSFTGYFDYSHRNTSYGASALLAPGFPSLGSVTQDMYTFGVSANYAVRTFYLRGFAQGEFSNNGLNDTVNAATGSANGRGFAVNLAAGNWFPLFNSTGVQAAMPTKALPQANKGFALFLDASIHGGYGEQRVDGFTESNGFIRGVENLTVPDVGLGARLVGVIPCRDHVWEPYIGATVDWFPGFKHTLDVPAQALAIADTFTYSQSTTFGGLNAGLNVINRSGVKVGAQAYYMASGDTNIVGGKVYLKIPLAFMTPAADSGIRTAK